MHLNNKGFAISSIVYSILILFLILLTSTLTLLIGRKTILDKSKREIMKKIDSMEEADVYNIDNYTKTGLVIHYDGIQNTRAGGHNASATKWENLISGSYDGILNGNGTWTGNGLNFDGNDDYVDVGAFNVINPGVTFEITLKYSDIKRTSTLVGNLDNGGYALEYQYDLPLRDADGRVYQHHSYYGNNTLTFYNQTTNSFNSLASPYETKQDVLYTVTGVIDAESRKVTLYENGERYSVSVSSLTLATPKNSTRLSIGAKMSGNSVLGQHLKGTVYSIRVYNRILNNMEIYKNHTIDQKRFA